MDDKIENAKTYLGKELETIFFRPLFADEGARELGIKVMYNMPAPTRLHFWHRPDDVLHKYTSAGWNGSASAERYTKTIELHRVKAEMSYSADEYFSLVYDSLAQSALTQLDDLTGTELEAAETALFRQAIMESVRATMWLGKTAREEGLRSRRYRQKCTNRCRPTMRTNVSGRYGTMLPRSCATCGRRASSPFS